MPDTNISALLYTRLHNLSVDRQQADPQPDWKHLMQKQEEPEPQDFTESILMIFSVTGGFGKTAVGYCVQLRV